MKIFIWTTFGDSNYYTCLVRLGEDSVAASWSRLQAERTQVPAHLSSQTQATAQVGAWLEYLRKSIFMESKTDLLNIWLCRVSANNSTVISTDNLGAVQQQVPL